MQSAVLGILGMVAPLAELCSDTMLQVARNSLHCCAEKTKHFQEERKDLGHNSFRNVRSHLLAEIGALGCNVILSFLPTALLPLLCSLHHGVCTKLPWKLFLC